MADSAHDIAKAARMEDIMAKMFVQEASEALQAGVDRAFVRKLEARARFCRFRAGALRRYIRENR